jgi:hypothetical protein
MPSSQVIYTYTRAQALADGVLIDSTKLAQEAGFNWPVAFSDSLYHQYIVPSLALTQSGQSIEGRAWDTLHVLRSLIHTKKDCDFIRFSVAFLMDSTKEPETVELIAVAGPGDRFEPVITVMLPGDD